MFIDEATILVQAGRGGNGCISFRREKFVPKGGPNGGDGGDGGNVILLVDPNLRNLLVFRHQKRFTAGHGGAGRGKEMTGPRGQDCVIRVPPGTVVQDAPSGRPVADMIHAGQSIVVARAGRGGKGNTHFKTATRRAPRIATDGTEGEQRELALTLKLLADVGLVGLPNVGKSTLLRRVSNATPKVGAFPFTTLRPNLGIVSLGPYSSFVMADLPGLVEGAHEGRGLGDRFLRHIERTRLLLLLIDSASPHPEEDLSTLLGELESFSANLIRRPRVLCYSRSDLTAGSELRALDGTVPLRISAVTGEMIPELLRLLQTRLEEMWAAEGGDLDPLLMEDREIDAPVVGSARTLDSFADQVDSGRPMGPTPWPKEFYVEVGTATHEGEPAPGPGLLQE